ncbi:TPA_asm: oncoid2 [African termite bidnaparvovirus]|nr:TPA_asm: oncoid2 [African termite bidnaparvovirus]
MEQPQICTPFRCSKGFHATTCPECPVFWGSSESLSSEIEESEFSSEGDISSLEEEVFHEGEVQCPSHNYNLRPRRLGENRLSVSQEEIYDSDGSSWVCSSGSEMGESSRTSSSSGAE